jgi:microcystin-dependent protein
VPLETATYIHQLEPANPAGTDQLAQGDDHLRMIKAVLKATFPNITGPVLKSQSELNSTGFSMPIGFIGVWYGSAETVPSGWAICNGQTVTRSDGGGSITLPDLRDRVVIGAGTAAPQGTQIGAATAAGSTGAAGSHTHSVSGGEHTHSGTVQGTALTEAQLPSHKHANGVTDISSGLVFSRGSTPAATTTEDSIDNDGAQGTHEGWTSSVGGGQAHSHGLTINSSSHSHTVGAGGEHTHSLTVSTLQPSTGLHFIMKV